MTTLTQTRSITLKLETAFIFLLGLAIFISKPLIYLSILLLVGVTLVRIATEPDYRHELFNHKLFWASTGLFVLGVVSAAIGSNHIEDIGWIANKTLILTLVVPLLLAFAHKTNRSVALGAAIAGFWIAFALTGEMYQWAWSGDRYEGQTWDVGMWGVVCAMLIALLTPMVFETKTRLVWRLVFLITIATSILMLITTLSRGPWLGAFAAVLIYLIAKQRKALTALALTGAAVFYIANTIWPQQVASFQQRVESITNTESDASNYIRLALWETGLALAKSQLTNGDVQFWVGNGHSGKAKVANDFYYQEFKDKAQIKPGALAEMGWRVDDMHNMYVESLIQNGFLWTVACLILLAWFSLRRGLRHAGLSKTLPALPLLVCYLTVGMTYAILPHFALMIFIFFASLAISAEVSDEDD